MRKLNLYHFRARQQRQRVVAITALRMPSHRRGGTKMRRERIQADHKPMRRIIETSNGGKPASPVTLSVS